MGYPDRPTAVNADSPFDLPPPPSPSSPSFYSWLITLWQWTLKFGVNIKNNVNILATSTTSSLATKLSKDSADTLAGVVSVAAASTAGIKVGNITWDNGGSLTGGTGVAITSNGIVGALGGAPKFVLKADGTATFGGDLTAATGTFGGSLTAGSGTITGNLTIGTGGALYSGATGILSGNGYWIDVSAGIPRFRVGTTSGGALTKGIYWDGSNFTVLAEGNLTHATYQAAVFGDGTAGSYNGVVGLAAGGIGVLGQCSGAGYAVEGYSSSASGVGVRALNDATGTALQVNGTSSFDNTMTITALTSGTTDMGFSTDSGSTWGKVRFRVAPGP